MNKYSVQFQCLFDKVGFSYKKIYFRVRDTLDLDEKEFAYYALNYMGNIDHMSKTPVAIHFQMNGKTLEWIKEAKRSIKALGYFSEVFAFVMLDPEHYLLLDE